MINNVYQIRLLKIYSHDDKEKSLNYLIYVEILKLYKLCSVFAS